MHRGAGALAVITANATCVVDQEHVGRFATAFVHQKFDQLALLAACTVKSQFPVADALKVACADFAADGRVKIKYRIEPSRLK